MTAVCGAVIGVALEGANDPLHPNHNQGQPLARPRGVIGFDTDCVTCHPTQWFEWQTSRHAQAWVDPIFQAEFAHGRQAWCVGCHAPSAPDPTAPNDADPRIAQGVGCEACHERSGQMVSSRRAANSPHATLADPSFGSPTFCASCHEFNFPILGARGVLVRYTDEPMQATVSQWRATNGKRTCLDCHTDGSAGHAFRGSHDPERVAAALEITTCRADGHTLEVAVANVGAAHNVPSGGVHRRMVLRAWRSDAPERLVEHMFGRRFRPLRGGGKETLADTTIAPGDVHRTQFSLSELGASHEADAINVELRYIYALDERLELPVETSRLIWHERMELAEFGDCVR